MKNQLVSKSESLGIENAIWLACAIDTDGHLSIKKRKIKSKEKTYDQCIPQIGFTNYNYDIVKKASDIFQTKPQKYRHTWRAVVHDTNRILRILNDCLPHLIVKKEKSGMMIEYCKFRLRNRHVVDRYKDDLLFFEEMKMLNHLSRRRRE